MNKILNDRGQLVLAVGAPGSIERAKIEYPALIDTLNTFYWASGCTYSKYMADDDLRVKHSITSKLERKSIINCTDIGKMK